MNRSSDTIVAPATPVAVAGLAIVRVSGPDAFAVASRIFDGADLASSESHRAHHGWVMDSARQRLDEVLALVLRAPRSYTGEDTVELSCHGNPMLVEEIVAAAVAAGARVAERGEFTRRAFLNGRLDLCQAEAVADLIAAESAAGRRAALEQLRGALSARVQDTRAALLRLLADVEASIDFVEEDVEFFDRGRAGEQIAAAAAQIDRLLATAGDGELLRSGIRISLAGAPNVGKSSLFNRLLGKPRAIVTEHPGTTRDVVSETLRLGTLSMTLEDTAGLRRAARDPVERIGIERSRQSHADADIVLHVLDATRRAQDDEIEALRGLDAGSALVVLNKIDVLSGAARRALSEGSAGVRALAGETGVAIALGDLPCVAVSATTGERVEDLLESIARIGKLRRLALQNEALVTINARHREALLRAGAALRDSEADLAAREPAEVLAADLRDAVMAIGEVSGERVTEEVLDSIFARFCIGK